MELHRLTDEFYIAYGECKEIMKKKNRPYCCLFLEVGGIQYAIPVRHHFKHNMGFHTIGEAGIDYTKAVVISDSSYVSVEFAQIDSEEWRILRANRFEIQRGFARYIEQYKRAKKHPEYKRNQIILKYSTLQYFEGLF